MIMGSHSGVFDKYKQSKNLVKNLILNKPIRFDEAWNVATRAAIEKRFLESVVKIIHTW